MTDVNIDVSGNLSTPPTMETNGNNGLQRIVRNIPSMQEFVKTCKESIRPWTLFANTNNFKLPPSFPRFLKRVVNNVKYFQGNYVVISLILMAYCLLASPYLLLLVIASLGGCYILSLRNADRKLYIQGREVTLLQQYCLVGAISLPVYYWAGAGEAVFWVLGASCVVISVHAGLYNIDAILNEQDQINVLIQQI
ncbi:prenylated Rab acceptor protein 1 [Cimex lectularius]|uniref:PRA1 family protein n=1 Tax=Cimex lectularius TaxID=79782 RepID=A0A8I6RD68_CIMLE|nr:prenylated Rab acceptor protein 1 [Cimex lectularius]